CVGGGCGGARSVEALVAESCVVQSSAVSTGALDCGPGRSMDALTTSLLRLEAGPAADALTPPLVCLLSPADDGTVYCVGADFDNEGVPGCTCGDTRCLECPDLVLDATGTSRLRGVTDLAVGLRHACVISGGLAYCMGANDQGQKGYRRTSLIDILATQVEIGDAQPLGQVVAGANFTCVREADGTRGRAYCFGANDQSCLGRPPNVMTNFVPMPVVHRDGSTPMDGVVDIACAGDGALPTNPSSPHCCAVRADGEVFCWGGGGFGQLDGIATTLTRNLPRPLERPSGMGPARDVEVAPTVSCAVTVDDEVWCWGAGGAVRAAAATADHAPIRIDFPDGVDVRDISLSAGLTTGVEDAEIFAMARSWDGRVWCWGSNYDHQCAAGPAEDVTAPIEVTR
ncbi:MAG: hypothetical protein KC619_34190, partial [Myxococcales bacterium]|nr:hypothetical protein [Myxococcales bacterium]